VNWRLAWSGRLSPGRGTGELGSAGLRFWQAWVEACYWARSSAASLANRDTPALVGVAAVCVFRWVSTPTPKVCLADFAHGGSSGRAFRVSFPGQFPSSSCRTSAGISKCVARPSCPWKVLRTGPAPSAMIPSCRSCRVIRLIGC
jgi:hypothetical protein